MATMLRIALASPPVSGSADAAMPWVERFIAEAAAGGADIVCFPECYVPGLRGQDFAVEAHDPARLAEARERVRELAATHRIAVIIPMDWDGPEGILNVAFVISADGEILGCQTKNQIAPEEDAHYVPGRGREMFEVNGVPFAISICHEGWRYPESVRWGAVRGAAVVFHPHHAGNELEGITVESFGAASSPYFEKAMTCRALENAVYFASVGYALRYQEAATALISPEGACIDHLPYGRPGLLIADIDPGTADRLYARRLAPETYR